MPLGIMFIFSLCNNRFPSLPWPGWSFKWYVELFQNTSLHMTIYRSIAVGLCVALVGTLLGFGSGYLFSRLKGKRGTLYLIIMTIPALIPYLLYGYCFADFSKILGLFRTTLAVIMAHIVVLSPISCALCYHRFRNLNMDIEDAARELGASEFRVLFQIVGGQTWKTILATFLVVYILSWDEYIISWFVSGFNKTYPVHIRNILESTMSPEIFSAGSLIAVISILLFCISIMLLKARKY